MGEASSSGGQQHASEGAASQKNVLVSEAGVCVAHDSRRDRLTLQGRLVGRPCTMGEMACLRASGVVAVSEVPSGGNHV